VLAPPRGVLHPVAGGVGGGARGPAAGSGGGGGGGSSHTAARQARPRTGRRAATPSHHLTLLQCRERGRRPRWAQCSQCSAGSERVRRIGWGIQQGPQGRAGGPAKRTPQRTPTRRASHQAPTRQVLSQCRRQVAGVGVRGQHWPAPQSTVACPHCHTLGRTAAALTPSPTQRPQAAALAQPALTITGSNKLTLKCTARRPHPGSKEARTVGRGARAAQCSGETQRVGSKGWRGPCRVRAAGRRPAAGWRYTPHTTGESLQYQQGSRAAQGSAHPHPATPPGDALS
jgi:hypothetical protein